MDICQQFQEILSFTNKAGWAICPKCREILGHLLTKPGPSTKNSDNTWTNQPRILTNSWPILPRILDDLPRILTNSWPFAEKSWNICQECQQILGHLLRLPRTAIKICLPRMPHLPWLALAAGSFGSLGSR